MIKDGDAQQNGDSLGMLKYVRLFWRWLWLIVLCTALAGGAAYYLNKSTQPIYSTSVVLLVNQFGSSSSLNADFSSPVQSEQLANTYVQMFNTNLALGKLTSRLEPAISSVVSVGQIRASAVPNMQLIRIVVEDTDPQRAALIGNALAQTFIEFINEQRASRYTNLIASITVQTQDLEKNIIATQAEIASLPTDDSVQTKTTLGLLQTKLLQYQTSYASLLNNLSMVRIAQAQTTSSLSLAQQAQVPTVPLSSSTLKNTLIAAALGAILAAGMILLIDLLDDTINTPEDIKRVTHAPLLGTIANIKGRNPAQMLITSLMPHSPVSEAYRVMRTTIQYSGTDQPFRSLLITSAAPFEGKSTTAANLAVVFAQAGKHVILIDADLRRPSQHNYFTLPNSFGVVTAIKNASSPAEKYLQDTKIENLRVMTSGPIPPNPAELLDSQRLGQVLNELSQKADVLLLDSPPILTVTDAAQLSHQVTGTILVVDAGKSRISVLPHALEKVQAVGGKVIGIVLNRVVPSRMGSYSKYYYYQYTKADKRQKRTHKV